MNSRPRRSPIGFLPDRLRWLIFLPVAVAGLLLTYTLVAVLRHSAGELWSNSYLAQLCIGLFGSFFSAVLFVNLGAGIAPSRKGFVARILALTFLIMNVARLYDMWRWNSGSDPLWGAAIAAAVTGVAGAFISAFFYGQRDLQARQNQTKTYQIDSFEKG